MIIFTKFVRNFWENFCKNWTILVTSKKSFINLLCYTCVAWPMRTESGLSHSSLSFVHPVNYFVHKLSNACRKRLSGSLSSRTSDSAVHTFWPRANTWHGVLHRVARGPWPRPRFYSRGPVMHLAPLDFRKNFVM